MFNTLLLVKISWVFFLIIPIISFLLPSTGTALVQVGTLLALQSVLLFLIADQMTGAIIWMIYVGAISVLFLVAITSLTPMQWKITNKGWLQNSAIYLTGTLVLIAAYGTAIEVLWITTRTNPAMLHYVNLGSVGGFTALPNSYTKVDPFLFQAIGFTEEATIYVLCGVLLLMGMFIVIQTIVTPSNIAKHVDASSSKY